MDLPPLAVGRERIKWGETTQSEPPRVSGGGVAYGSDDGKGERTATFTRYLEILVV